MTSKQVTKNSKTSEDKPSRRRTTKEEAPVVETESAPLQEKKAKRVRKPKESAPVEESVKIVPETVADVSEAVVEDVVEAVVEAVVEDVVESSEDKKSEGRRTVTRDSVEADFESLVSQLLAESDALKVSGKDSKTVRLLRQIAKRVRQLKTDSARVSKQKTRTTRPSNTSSGFMKAVKISKEMSKFTNWNPEELYTRVAVTKELCQYIKEHDLQNPEDRRQILPDEKLAKLLAYDGKKDKPLTYYYLQQKIQPHFVSSISTLN